MKINKNIRNERNFIEKSSDVTYRITNMSAAISLYYQSRSQKR